MHSSATVATSNLLRMYETNNSSKRPWSLRLMAASAITAVALAGSGGAVLAATTDSGTTQQGPGQGPGSRGGGPPGIQGGPPQLSQLPSATLPRDDSNDT
jgi:hypothetical protein